MQIYIISIILSSTLVSGINIWSGLGPRPTWSEKLWSGSNLSETKPIQFDKSNIKLKKFIISENNIILKWSNGERTSSILDIIDKEACIYKSVLEQDPESNILITGCPSEIRRFEIQSNVFGDILGKILLDDTVEEIILEGVNDILEQPTSTTRVKREYEENPEFDTEFPDRNIAFSIQSKKAMTLKVFVYLSPSFRNAVSSLGQDPTNFAKQILSYAKLAFTHDTLDVKIAPEAEFVDTKMDYSWLAQFRDNLPSQNLKVGSAHLLLLANKNIHGNPDIEGVAKIDSICDQDNRKSSSLVKLLQNDVLVTGKVVAHEIAHHLGIGHDFLSDRKGRNRVCGPGRGKPNGDLMNYGKPIKLGWSSCSNEDFNNYITRTLQSGNFCLQKSDELGVRLKNSYDAFELVKQLVESGKNWWELKELSWAIDVLPPLDPLQSKK